MSGSRDLQSVDKRDSLTIYNKVYDLLPSHLDGSMCPYDLGVDESLSEVVPDSLTPVFINYLGRHGARWLSSGNKTAKLRAELLSAADKGVLTGQGRKFLSLLDEVDNATAGRWGALDSIGIREQSELGGQLYRLSLGLLNEGDVSAIATYVPRVVMSMYMFCHSLDVCSSHLNINTGEGRRYDSQLRYFDSDSIYHAYLSEGDWKPVYDEFVEKNVSGQPAARLVGGGWPESQLREITLRMYGVLQSLRAAGLPAPSEEWMTPEEYRKCWEAGNLDHYLRRTDNAISDIPGRAALPLLESFIEYGDMAADGRIGQLKAMLRFGHAETLMPFLSLIRVPGCYWEGTDFKAVADHWKDYEVVPLASNLMVMSLKAPSGEIYCAMRFNGRFVEPLSDGRKIVKWSQLKQYWLKQASAISR